MRLAAVAFLTAGSNARSCSLTISSNMLCVRSVEVGVVVVVVVVVRSVFFAAWPAGSSFEGLLPDAILFAGAAVGGSRNAKYRATTVNIEITPAVTHMVRPDCTGAAACGACEDGCACGTLIMGARVGVRRPAPGAGFDAGMIL